VFTGEFTGYVKRTDGHKRLPSRIGFKIETLWKGQLNSEAAFEYWDIPGRCGDLNPVKGRKYLIYVSMVKADMVVIIDCGRSRELKYASEDLTYFHSRQ
jgi:hypothetical protein